jgi:hypothetical protein
MPMKHRAKNMVLNRWKRYLGRIAGQFAPLRALEIGVFAAESAEWFLDNILVCTGDQYVGIDPWADGLFQGHNRKRTGAEIEEIARQRLTRFTDRVVLLKRTSAEAFRDLTLCELHLRPESFGLIHVDGWHSGEHVAHDSIMAWPLLQVGGLILWDDYHSRSYPAVREAVDAFLALIGDRAEVVFTRCQMCVRRLR